MLSLWNVTVEGTMPKCNAPASSRQSASFGIKPAAPAAEASRLVAEPVDEAVAATPGRVELRSVRRNGGATTVLRFAWGTRPVATVAVVGPGGILGPFHAVDAGWGRGVSGC